VFFVVIGAVLTLAVLAFGTLSVANLIGRVTDASPLSFGPEVKSVVVHTGSGGVTIHGSSRADISGQRSVEHSWQTPVLDEHVDGDTLTLNGSCKLSVFAWCSVSYTLDVPRGVRVDVESGAGDVSVANIDADVKAHTGAGQIDLTQLTGSLDVQTGAGSVSATQLASPTVQARSGAGSIELQFVRPPTKVDGRSGAGSLDIEVPHDATTYSVTGETGHGSRDINVANAPGSDHVMQLESGAGSTDVHYP
jgi:hypothetical protein